MPAICSRALHKTQGCLLTQLSTPGKVPRGQMLKLESLIEGVTPESYNFPLKKHQPPQQNRGFMRKQKCSPSEEKPPFHLHYENSVNKNEHTALWDVMRNLYLNKFPRNQEAFFFNHWQQQGTYDQAGK